MPRANVWTLASILALAGCSERVPTEASQAASAPVAADTAQAGAEFDAAINHLTRSYYAQVPEAATYNGIPDELTSDADARLNDRSVAGEAARVGEMEKRLAELQATSTESLSPDQRSIRDTLITLFVGALGPSRAVDYGSSFDVYGIWYLPYVINQNPGVAVDIPKLMEAQQTVRNAEDAKEYLQRLEQLPGILEGALAKMRHDVDLGAIPPDFIVAKAKAVVDAFAAMPASDNVLVASFSSKLKAANIADLHWDNLYFQYRNGALDEQMRLSYDRTMSKWMDNDAWRAWFRANATSFSPDLRELLKGRLRS